MMGLLMLQDGMPISYQVLSRNSSDVLSFLKAIESLKEHFF
jgi:transposase